MRSLRRHQRLALEALDAAWAAGRTRAWVVLPPGAGKTLVGLETARRLLAAGEAGKTVVLSPNTAIQGQWLRQARELGLDAGDARSLTAATTSLTYQSVAVFDPDAEVSEEGAARSLMSRLHDNGRALVAELQQAGPLLLVLDECHHLLEVWGRLLAELLELLPQARVLGLTATPPEALTRDEAALVDGLFGHTVFAASIPAVVREGDLAPFAELVWLTEPTVAEQDWLADSALRFAELVTSLTDPAFGTVPFLDWVRRRFVALDGGPTWTDLARTDPELTDAALRLHHAGLLDLPPGAVVTEEHRRDPAAEDWVELVDDWVRGHLAASGDPADAAVVAAIRRALPAVGYTLTRRGIRAGRSPVDRVLARSEAKTTATVEIVRHERLAQGDDLRLLVLTDHERATATLPADLAGVISEQAGSAHAVLAALTAESDDALLVTGATVAGPAATLQRLVESVDDPALRARLTIEPGPSYALLIGPWTSRGWVPVVTSFFEAGGCHVLVGTRGLLGEGWDARRVTGVVDLTAVTTTTAVVQTRGRALRIDPASPGKVALNWSVVCVAEGHPRGDNDWRRLVRKHTGFFGVDAEGGVVDGVGHLDPAFSPYAAPPVADFGAVNARMLVRAEDRDTIRRRWRIGEPYDDVAGRTVRIRQQRRGLPAGRVGPPAPAAVVVRQHGLEVRAAPSAQLRRAQRATRSAWLPALAVQVPWVVTGALPLVAVGIVGLLAVLGGALAWRRAAQRSEGERILGLAARPPSIAQVAGAVADGLQAVGLTGAGSEALMVEVDAEGEYHIRLSGVPESESDVFATALAEAVAPIASPRYVMPRWTVAPRKRSRRELRRIGAGRPVESDGVVWHAVPTVLGTRAETARAYAEAWDRWIGGGPPLYTGSPEGAGVLAAQRGADPFDVTTVIRRTWS